MTEAIEIQQATKAFREEVAKWAETKLRREGEDRGIPQADTLDKTTLREAIVQGWRDDRRADVAGNPQVRNATGLGSNRRRRGGA